MDEATHNEIMELIDENYALVDAGKMDSLVMNLNRIRQLMDGVVFFIEADFVVDDEETVH